MNTIAGYRATKDPKGALVVHDVPIFLECQRGKFHADEEWIQAAFQRAEQQSAEGYFPPLHIRHHEVGTEPERAGYFRIVRVAPMTYRGRERLALFADLVITDEWAQQGVLGHRLPYRSVEIVDPKRAEISSLALLDTEAPYLQLPMLMVSEVDQQSADMPPVAFAAFDNPWLEGRSEADPGLLVCFSRGAAPFLLTEEPEDMTVTKTKPKAPASGKGPGKAAPKAADPVKMQHGEGDDDKDEGEKMEGDEGPGLDVDAVCAAIESGQITIDDMDKLHASIAKRKAETAADLDAPAPAMAPGAESMSENKGDGVKFAQMQAEIDALKMQADQRSKAEKRSTDVSAALKRLEGRPVGADFPAELEKFHEEHGPEAFKAYVDALASKLGVVPRNGSAAERFGVQSGDVPESVLKFQAQGAERLRQATELAMQYRQLAERRQMLATEEQFVEQNMPPLEQNA